MKPAPISYGVAHEVNDGTSAGAKKAWETRQRGAAKPAATAKPAGRQMAKVSHTGPIGFKVESIGANGKATTLHEDPEYTAHEAAKARGLPAGNFQERMNRAVQSTERKTGQPFKYAKQRTNEAHAKLLRHGPSVLGGAASELGSRLASGSTPGSKDAAPKYTGRTLEMNTGGSPPASGSAGGWPGRSID